MFAASKQLGYIKGKLIYFKVSALSGMKPWAPTKTVKQPEYDKWQKFINDEKAKAPPGMKVF